LGTQKEIEEIKRIKKKIWNAKTVEEVRAYRGQLRLIAEKVKERRNHELV